MESERPWKSWGEKIKSAYKGRGLRAGEIAERMGVAESTLRSWMNGTREINLSEFFRLCQQAEVDPYEMLGADPPLSKEQAASLEKTVRSLLKQPNQDRHTR